MAGGYGLSRAIGGAVEGLNQVEARRDRETARERSETQYQQGQDDRSYNLARRGITDAREDEQYNRQKLGQERSDDFNKGLNGLMTGNTAALNEALNKHIGDENKVFDMQPNPNGDGTFITKATINGKTEEKVHTLDQIGRFVIGIKNKNPGEQIAEQGKLDREDKNKGADRKHDLAKIKADGDQKIRLEREKQKGSGGKTGAAAEKSKLAVSKAIGGISRNLYGTMFGDQWSFNKDQDKALYLNLSSLSEANYYASDNPNVNDAANDAYQRMREFVFDAEAEVNAAIDAGKIDKKDKDSAVVDLIDEMVSAEIKGMVPPPGQTLQRDGGNESPNSMENADIPLDAIKYLKNSPTDEVKSYFDQKYGEGAADKILTDEQIGNQSKAPAGVSRETGNSLIRSANASESMPTEKQEEEKPKLTRQQRRREGKQSQKAHRKIAVSEYKNEWINMDDSEKIEWWTDNAQALKAASPRSHKKANKEIIAIRNKSKIGRPSRAQ